MLTVAISGVLATLAATRYMTFVERARVIRARGQRRVGVGQCALRVPGAQANICPEQSRQEVGRLERHRELQQRPGAEAVSVHGSQRRLR